MGLFMLASVASAPVRFRVPSSHLDVQFPQGKINFSQKFPRQQLPPDNKLLPDSATRQIAGSKFLHSQGEPLATRDSAILTWPPVGVTKQKCIPRFPPCSEVATIKSVVVAELDSVRGLCLSVVSRPKEATQESGSCTTPRIAWCGYCLTREAIRPEADSPQEHCADGWCSRFLPYRKRSCVAPSSSPKMWVSSWK
jgi:hypothetical protein